MKESIMEETVGIPDIAAIRQRNNASQSEFAAMLGISVDTLQNWEQGRRVPEGPARVLLHVAARHPRIVRETARALRPVNGKADRATRKKLPA